MPRIASCILCSPVEQLDVDDHGTSLGRRCVFCGGAALALALLSPAALAEKEDPTRSKRPQTGDLFAFFAGDHAGQVIKPADLKAGGPPVLAWPMEPKSKVLRDGSRFNQVLPIRRGKVPNYTPVTKQRLENPEPGNWLLYRRTYDGHGFSPLKQINTTNVKNLVPVWTFSTGVVEGHEAPPMVNNGVMFVATPYGQVIALNAKTGDPIWRYKHRLPEDLFQLHPTSRGVALWQDKLFLAATDDHLIAIDAKTGKELWNTKVQDYQKGQYMSWSRWW
jgi:hypothetical protein